MQHSEHYAKVKRWFDLRMWSETRVRNAVEKDWITQAEFKEITGHDF